MHARPLRVHCVLARHTPQRHGRVPGWSAPWGRYVRAVCPVDATVVVGGNADFSVSVAGTPPLSFQWEKIAEGTTNVLAGQTNDTLQLTGLTGCQFVAALLCRRAER